jgi:PAS domain S-box-containing protein
MIQTTHMIKLYDTAIWAVGLVWIRCRGIAIRDQKGKPIRMLGAHTDLTELKLSVEKLKQSKTELEETNKKLGDALENISESRLSAILKTTVDGIITINEDGIVESLNKAAERIFGYQADEVIGRNVNILMPEPDHSYHNSYLERYIQSGQAKIIGIGREVEGKRRDGSLVPLHLSVSEAKLGDRVFFTGILRDITVQKEAQRTLQETTERLRLATQSANIGVWDWDVVNNILVWDDRMFSLYGITSNQFEGAYEAWQKGVYPEDLSRVKKEVRAALRGEKDFDTEFRVVWPTGEIHTIKAYAQVKRDPSDQPLQMIGVNWDITAEKESAEQLSRAKEQAETADRLKSSFLASMSHELRTPLNSIIGFSGRVIKKAGDLLPKQQLKNLKTVLRNAHHLLGLINDLLDISKIEAGKMEVFLEEFRLNAIVSEVLELTRPLIGEKDLQLTADLPEKQLVLYSDKIKLKQILINLISNAVKFTDKGIIRVEARKVYSPVDGDAFFQPQMDYVSLSVADTGIGMSPDDLQYVFEAFRQVDESLTRKVGGTGLGLNITKKFAELLQGKIEVDSVKGKGTTFTLTIPVILGDEVDVRKEVEVFETEEHELPATGPTVLCIDDDPEALDLLNGYLSDEGYKIKELKDRDTTKDIPVIIVSIVENLGLGYKLGAYEYIQKPILPEVLVGTLKKILRRKAETVLVVDDDPEVLDLVRQVLEEEKINVRTAENGLKALDSLKEMIPDLILLDLMMPEMDGFELINRLREAEEWNAIPVVIITAKTLNEQERLLLDERVEAIIAKEGRTTNVVLKEITETIKRIETQRP